MAKSTLLRSSSEKGADSPPPLPPRMELDMNPIVGIRKDSEEEEEKDELSSDTLSEASER